MAITLDPATQSEYLVGATVVARAQGVVAAFTGTVTCKIYDGSDVEKAAATFDSPWASASGATITIGEVGKLIVSDGGTPDDNWYVEISNGTRWLRGTFGLLGSGKDFTWSASTFATGQQAELGTVTLTASDPVTTSAPSNTAVPVINGTTQVGQVLSVTDGTWSGSPTPTYTYQWNRDGADLSGETAATYTLVSADEGAMIGARVTATNSAGSASASATAVGPIDPLVSALTFSGLPSPIPLYQGGAFSLASYVSGGVTPYTFSYTGTLPSGVSLGASSGVLTATSSATLGTSGSIQFHVDDSAAVASLPTFGVTSSVGGTNLPFAFGHVFVEGDIPSGSYVNSDLTDWQAVPTTYWPDGSLRHAIIAGRATCSANVLKSIALSVSATNRSGTALTEADLAAALPTTTLVAGGDSFTLNSLIGTAARHRTVCAGPVMSNWLYRRQIAGSNHLVAWFDVRLYIGGAVEIFPWIENCYLTVASPGADTRTYTLTIGVTQRFSSSIDMRAGTRVPLINNTSDTFKHWSYWAGTDPQITPQHDMDYLRGTRMVPNLTIAPAESLLSGLQTYYAPNTLAGVPAGMGAGGGNSAIIGSIDTPSQALFVSSDGDVRAFNATVAMGLSGGTWSIHYRAEASSTQGLAGYPNEPMRWSSYPNASLQVGQGASPELIGGDTAFAGVTYGTPVTTHQPSFGFLPWLITGRWYFLEEQIYWTNWNYLKATPNQRRGEESGQVTGTYPAYAASAEAGIIDLSNGTYPHRGGAWSLRALGQTVAILPTTHPCYAAMKASFDTNVGFYYDLFISGSYAQDATSAQYVGNALGLLGWYYGGQAAGTPNYLMSAFMNNFVCNVFPYLRELEINPAGTVKTELDALVQHALKWTVGVTGDASGFDYRWGCDLYDCTIGVNNPPTLDASFAALFAHNVAFKGWDTSPSDAILRYGNVEIQNYDGGWPYFGSHLTALAYAVDAGVTGAAAARARVLAASNWPTLNALQASSAKLHCYAVTPRSA